MDEATDGEPVLRARALTKHFPVRGRGARSVHAVDALDLAIGRGEVVALVGESGSGKSTVARLLAMLLPATSGQVELEGRPVRVRWGRAFRRYCRDVQMILQDPFASLNAVHTVRYVLTRAVRIHHPDLGPAERQARMEELLRQVDLTPPERYLPKYPHELSGGQRQRVAIARALAASPKVLLADEPISMLDVSIRVGILNLLQDLRTRLRVGVLYITHDIASARYFADRTVVMYAGQAVERGSSESVTQRPSHPYTQLLIASAPDPDAPEGSAAAVRSGEPPSLVDPGPGCRFRARCPHAMPVCEQQDPPFLAADGDGHEARCWLLDPAVVKRSELQAAGPAS